MWSPFGLSPSLLRRPETTVNPMFSFGLRVAALFIYFRGKEAEIPPFDCEVQTILEIPCIKGLAKCFFGPKRRLFGGMRHIRTQFLSSSGAFGDARFVNHSDIRTQSNQTICFRSKGYGVRKGWILIERFSKYEGVSTTQNQTFEFEPSGTIAIIEGRFFYLSTCRVCN